MSVYSCLSYPACISSAPCYIVVLGLLILSHKRHDFFFFGGGEMYWTLNVCFDFLYKFCLQHVYLSKYNSARS